MGIGERIKSKRIEKEWSLQELANRMGYANKSTVARIESGNIDIPQSRIVQFAEVLGVSVAYLMGWDAQIKQDPIGTAERHFEILMDEDIADIFEEFKTLDTKQRQIVKDLVHTLAESKNRG